MNVFIGLIFILLASNTVLAQYQYQVYFGITASRSSENSSAATSQITIVERHLETHAISIFQSRGLVIPTHGFANEFDARTPDALNPFVVAAILEEGLNEGKITFNEAQQILVKPQWNESFFTHASTKALHSPQKYRVFAQEPVYSIRNRLSNSMSIVITGPGIVDGGINLQMPPIDPLPMAFTSRTLTIPFRGLRNQLLFNANMISPYVVAARLQEKLNEKRSEYRLDIKNVQTFLQTENWNQTYLYSYIGNLYAVEEFRVMFQTNTTSISRSGKSEGTLVVTGPGIFKENYGVRLSDHIESAPLLLPENGFTEPQLVNPFMLAALIEDGLKSKRVSVAEVKSFLSEKDWHQKSLWSAPFIEKLRPRPKVKSCKAL